MKTRTDDILEGAATYAAYWRANPHRFCQEYLHLDLRLFQKILIVMMNLVSVFILIGARGYLFGLAA